MQQSIELSLVLPAYNEASNIARVVREAMNTMRTLNLLFEIIVVNDGSVDETHQHIPNDPHVVVVTHERNQGYGAALKSGFAKSSGKWVAFVDADGQFVMDDLKKLWRLRHKSPLVAGVRIHRADALRRTKNSRLWTWLANIAFGIRSSDLNCAMKLMSGEIVRALPLRSRGATVNGELLGFFARRGIAPLEAPIRHRPRAKGIQTGAQPRVILKAIVALLPLALGPAGNPHLKQMLKFAAVGAVVTSIDFATLNFLHLAIKMPVLGATALAFIIATIFSYFGNSRWTFGARRLRGSDVYFKSAFVGFGGLLLTEIIMWALNVRLGLYYNFAKLIAVAVVFFWNYGLSHQWAYRRIAS